MGTSCLENPTLGAPTPPPPCWSSPPASLSSPWSLPSSPTGAWPTPGSWPTTSMPGNSVFLKRYLNFWSMPDVDAMAESVMETPLEVSISEDGTMLTMVYGEETMLTFGVGKDITDPTTGNARRITARLLAPNSFTLETEAKTEGIYEVRTFTFSPIGAQVHTVASKPGTWSLMGNTVAYNAMMERVDEDGKPAPLTTLGWF